MAFKNKDMSVIAYANGFTLWHYKTNEDTVKQLIDNSKYFAKLYTLMHSGDIVIANLKDETTFLVIDSVGEESVKLRRM
jgi:hypothetical protein